MKNVFILFSILISSLTFSQNVFWYDVMLEVDGKNASTVASLVDDFYSNHKKSSDVTVEFSSIPLKGPSEKATHIISIASNSSQSLADFRNSLKGENWDLYISKMSNYVKSSRASAGKSLITNGSKTNYPIGQAWVFKATNPKLPSMVEAFGKLIKSYNFDGFVGLGQIVHGTENGESVYIYGTYSNLNDAFNFGPQSKKESAAFAEFAEVFDAAAQYSKSFTRVLIKSY
ncbi:hypothetical protein DEJ39_01135 [Bacteroidetes bacterium SCGC AAA795-G10]|nr:hypothetical protein DEJ39_01135 [Bacteroidetes bacterium SCGC AAA795-G10]